MSRATAIVLALLTLSSLALAAQGAPAPEPATSSGFFRVSTNLGFGAAEMIAAPGGVDAVVAERWFHNVSGGIYRVTETGAALAQPGDFRPDVARDADGALYAAESAPFRVVRLDAAGNVPVAQGFALFGFGEDSMMYGLQGGDFVKVANDRTVTVVAPLRCHCLATAFAPDGTLYVNDGFSTISRIDPETGTMTHVVTLSQIVTGLAFDAAGMGYVLRYDGALIAFDPSDGDQWSVGTIGVSSVVGNLAFSDTSLWVSYLTDGAEGPRNGGIGYLDLGVQGFEGFRPEFDMPPLPDLSIVDFREERAPFATPAGEVENVVNEARTLVLTVRNEGAAASLPGPVSLHRSGLLPEVRQAGATQSWWTATLPALAPGGSATLRFAWDTTGAVGRQTLVAYVDSFLFAGETNLEVDENDNTASFATVVRAPLGVGPW